MQWATHSHPDFVDKANWNGDVAASTAGPNCWAMVRATNLRMTSPATMPPHTSVALAKGCQPATRITSTMDGGTSPRARRSATRERRWQSLGESSKSRKCSHVIPEGPPPTANCDRMRFHPVQMACELESLERPREVLEAACLGPSIQIKWLWCPGPNLHPPTPASHWRAHPIAPSEVLSTPACPIQTPGVFPVAEKELLLVLNNCRWLSEVPPTARRKTSRDGEACVAK